MTISARPYQTDGIERVRAAIRGGARRVLVVAATGAGKTIIAAIVISGAVSKGKRILFLAHRREIIYQTVAKLEAANIDPDQIGVIVPGSTRRNLEALVKVASIATLKNYKTMPAADIVFIDECHHAVGAMYRSVLDQYPAAVHIGLTATPFRLDGTGLGEMFDKLVVIATPKELIKQGYLVDPKVFTHPKTPNFSKIKTGSNGDFDETQLAETMDKPSLIGDLVEHYQKHAAGLRAVAFAVNIKHSQNIAAQFNASGIRAEHVDGGTEAVERDAIFSRLRSGETLVVSNCMVATEGWDEPTVKSMIMARPTQSLSLWIQMAGRCLRPWPEHPEQRAVILDHSGNAVRHGLPQDDQDYTLEGRRTKKRQDEKSESVRTCPECFAVLPAETLVCPLCGHEFKAEAKELDSQIGDLVEVTTDIEREKTRLRKAIQRHAAALDKTRGWKNARANSLLKNHFKKSRQEMDVEELTAALALVRQWLRKEDDQVVIQALIDPEDEVVEWAI